MKTEKECRGIKSIGAKCLVVGSGISGIGSVGLLEHMGANVTLYDSNEKLTARTMREKLPGSSRAICVAGVFPEELLKETETVVLSPGVPVDIPLVNNLRDHGAEIIGEIEL